MVQPSDDRRHAATSEDPLWGESWYFNLCDPGNNVVLFTRIGVYPNKGVANMALLLAVDGKEAYNRGWHNLPLPAGDVDAGLTVGGVTYTAIELLKRFKITFADAQTPLSVDLVWEGVMPVHNAMAGMPANQATSFHLQQAGRVTGTIRLRDREWQITGVGNRDHGTGTRNWAAFTGHEVAWPVFPDGTALGIAKVNFDGGGNVVMGWAYDGKKLQALTLQSFQTVLNDEGKAVSARVVATDASGTRYDLTATRKAVCHWPFDGYLLNEGMFEFRLPDGRVGYGLLELGVRLGA